MNTAAIHYTLENIDNLRHLLCLVRPALPGARVLHRDGHAARRDSLPRPAAEV